MLAGMRSSAFASLLGLLLLAPAALFAQSNEPLPPAPSGGVVPPPPVVSPSPTIDTVPTPAPSNAAPPPVVSSTPTADTFRVAAPDARRARREANMRLRLRLLGDDLQTLDQRSYTGRYVDAISSIVIGGALIALGAAVEELDEGSRRLLYFSGAVSAGQGALSLAFVPSMGEDALRFTAMDDQEMRDARRKLRFGERALENAAGGAKTDRLVNALGGMGLGVAYYGIALPIWGLTDTVLDYLLIAYAAIVVVQGVIALVTSTPAERMWDVYVETAREHPVGRRRRPNVIGVGERGPVIRGEL